MCQSNGRSQLDWRLRALHPAASRVRQSQNQQLLARRPDGFPQLQSKTECWKKPNADWHLARHSSIDAALKLQLKPWPRSSTQRTGRHRLHPAMPFVRIKAFPNGIGRP